MAAMTEIIVNGSRHQIAVETERTLLSVLRDDLDLIGAKYGCGEAQCGACLVLIDGQRAPSCNIPFGSVAGKQITTIEGLEQDGKLHPVQEAFLELVAMQCGYCTPGMIMASVALLDENAAPSDAQIKCALETNICRCGAHPRILAAVRRASDLLRAQTA